MRNKLQYLLIQGDPNRNFLFQIAVSLKRSIFDPSLKAKMCFKSGGFFFYFQLFIYNFRLFVHNFRLFVYNFQKNPPLFKPILVFTTWGQIYIVSELWLFEIKNFDLGHPVVLKYDTKVSHSTSWHSKINETDDKNSDDIVVRSWFGQVPHSICPLKGRIKVFKISFSYLPERY